MFLAHPDEGCINMGRTCIAILSALLILGALITGCASKRPPQEAPTENSIALSGGEYHIGVDDRLQISVWKNAELSITVPVRPDGMFSMPLIGDVKAGGLTTSQVADNIKQRLSVYIREPSVAVIVVDLRSSEFISRVRVTGAVRTPRSLPFRQGMTVLDAVLEAGGVNEFASANRAKLYRKEKDVTEVYDVELGDILNKGRLESNYPLHPGDVVTVPERIF
jgi:polysaccharide biosynthesis/export protein